MKKILMIVLICMVGLFISCGEEATEKEFMEMITETTCYKVEGVMESFYEGGSKQSEFKVLYKSPNAIKIVLKSVNSTDSQIILKNGDGVYVLIPTINKNFKIQSEWPTNGSYPYLLGSLCKDIANTEAPVITEDEKTKTIETNTTLYKDAIANKQKIILNKETNLPVEVQIYDTKGNLYIRVLFTKIELDTTIEDSEFKIADSMQTMRSEMEDTELYPNRSVKYPTYCPEGSTLQNEKTEASADGKKVYSIMTYTGDNTFTIIQEYVNDQETISYSQEIGYIIHVLGTPVILKETGLQSFYDGVEYTVASTDLSVEEMIKVLESYMIEEVEK